ncbi:unnamed protein product [Schistosoma intercalatum]|nr:unnamed protein product [Schistosoma intercalatum]CAH8565134.1 unnamed protein product [Schistosoma haematobium]
MIQLDSQVTTSLFWAYEHFKCPRKFTVLEDKKIVDTSDANLPLSCLKTVIKSPLVLLYDNENWFSLASLLSYRSFSIPRISLVAVLRTFSNSSLSLGRDYLLACSARV